jgi:hypothetical protein
MSLLRRDFRQIGDGSVCGHFWTCCCLFVAFGSLKRLPEIRIEKVNVGVQGEARRRVAQPALNLDGVAPRSEQAGRDGVPEGVERRPLNARLLTGG